MEDTQALNHMLFYNISEKSKSFINNIKTDNNLIKQIQTKFSNPYLLTQLLIYKINKIKE